VAAVARPELPVVVEVLALVAVEPSSNKQKQ
jgi:hypothetical protein